ncbi:MAG: hypothetical protein FWD82_08615 [Defluviitaleaceae bacterium]|nr:hypothetical protein [Defluviitaleaceae bacterium]
MSLNDPSVDLKIYLQAVLSCESTLLALTNVTIDGKLAGEYLPSRDVCEEYIVNTSNIVENERNTLNLKMNEVEKQLATLKLAHAESLCLYTA